MKNILRTLVVPEILFMCALMVVCGAAFRGFLTRQEQRTVGSQMTSTYYEKRCTKIQYRYYKDGALKSIKCLRFED